MPTTKPTQHRDEYLHLRIDAELKDQATEGAAVNGGLSKVVRALLRMFVARKITLDETDLRGEVRQANRTQKGRG